MFHAFDLNFRWIPGGIPKSVKDNAERCGEYIRSVVTSTCTSTRKTISTNFSKYGHRAFSDLTKDVEDKDLTLDEKKRTIDSLIAAKHYLKTDFKINIICIN